MDNPFLEDDTTFFLNSDNQRIIKSFIAMRVLSFHSIFHYHFEDDDELSEKKDDFLKEYSLFLKSLEKIFNEKQVFLNYYISFSKISLLTICSMGDMQSRLTLLKKLSEFKNDKTSFIELHSSHADIIMHVFLSLIALIIAQRAPTLFSEDNTEEEEEEEEEAEKEDDPFTIKNPNNIDQQIKFIQEYINFFRKTLKGKLSFNKEDQELILIKAITDNGALEITENAKKILNELAFDINKYGVHVAKCEGLDNIENFDTLMKTVHETIDNINFLTNNYRNLTNPQFYISKNISRRLGTFIESKNCHRKENKHYEFIACNNRDLSFTFESSKSCPYCFIDEDTNQIYENRNYLESMYYDTDNFDPKVITYLNIYEIASQDKDLSPLEDHLLRILFFAFDENKNSLSNIKISLCAIAALLFPYTPFEMSSKITVDFVCKVFEGFKAYFKIIENEIRSSRFNTIYTYREMRKICSVILSHVMKKSLETAIKNAQKTFSRPKNSIKVVNLSLLGSKFFLKKFLIDPYFRKNCPVIYTYMRLNEKFDRVRFIKDVVQLITLIFNYVNTNIKDIKNAMKTKINDINGITVDLLESWRKAAQCVECDLMTKEARLCLNKTLKENPNVKSFLPRNHQNWPVMNVMLSLSDAHNQFVSELSQHTDILIYNVTDFDMMNILENDYKYRIRSTVLNIPFLNAIKGCIKKDGQVHINKKIEKKFCAELSNFSFCYIIHTSLSLKAKFMNCGESIISKFNHFVKPKKLSKSQINQIIELKQNGKGTGLLMLLQKLMYIIIRNNMENDFVEDQLLIDYIIQLIESSDKYFLMSINEKDSFEALVINRNRLRNQFTINQIGNIYDVLIRPIDETLHISDRFLGDNFADQIRVNIINNKKNFTSKIQIDDRKVKNLSKKIKGLNLKESDLMQLSQFLTEIMGDILVDPENYDLNGEQPLEAILQKYAETFSLSKHNQKILNLIYPHLNNIESNYLLHFYQICSQLI